MKAEITIDDGKVTRLAKRLGWTAQIEDGDGELIDNLISEEQLIVDKGIVYYENEWKAEVGSDKEADKQTAINNEVDGAVATTGKIVT